MLTRLDRLLSNRGYCSRGDVRKFMRHHEVRCADRDDVGPSERVESTTVTIDGEPIDPEPGMVVLLNKPCGYVCSHVGNEGASVYELLPPRFLARKPTVASVGRLDKDTSGLLLFTDDGVLLHNLTSPKHRVPRVYQATLSSAVPTEASAIFASGTLMLPEETTPCLPAELVLNSPTDALITVYEGRYHQVRRMFSAVGTEVLTLTRLSHGGLTCSELPEGDFRYLTAAEIESLKQ